MKDNLTNQNCYDMSLKMGTILSGHRLVFYNFRLDPVTANISKGLTCNVPKLLLAGPV